MSVNPGARLGPYVVGRRLGAGPSGERWAASEPGVDRPVVLTVTPLPDDPGAREAIREGLRRRARLEHPSIPAIYDAGEEGGVAWTARRAVAGRTLAEAGPLPPAARERVAAELHSALRALADAGIAPRGVSAEDVVLEGGRAHLVPADQGAGGDAAGAAHDIDALLRAGPSGGVGRRALLVAGLASVVAVVAVTVGVVLALRGGEAAAPAVQGPSGAVVARIPFGRDGPFGVAFDGERAWAIDIAGRIVRLDPRSNTIAGTRTRVARFGGRLVAHGGSLWLGRDEILRIDPDTLRVTGRLRIPGGFLVGFGFAGGRLLATVAAPGRAGYGTLLRFDPVRLVRIGRPIPLPFGTPLGIAGTGEVAWVSGREGGTVTRIDARTGATRTTSIGLDATLSDAASATGIWVPSSWDATMVHLDAAGGIDRVLPVGGFPLFAIASGGSVWIEDFQPPQLRRLDPARSALVGTPIALPRFGNVWPGLGDLWVTQEHALLRVRPTTPAPASPPRPTTPDDVLRAGPIPARTRLRTDALLDPVSLEVPSDAWLAGAPAQRDGLFLIYRLRNRAPLDVVDLSPTAIFGRGNALRRVRTRAEAIAALRARDDLEVGRPRRARVAGQDAVEVDVRSVATRPVANYCERPCSILFPLSGGVTIDMQREERLRMRIFEHRGRVHLVWYDVGPRGDARFREEAARIVASLRFARG